MWKRKLKLVPTTRWPTARWDFSSALFMDKFDSMLEHWTFTWAQRMRGSHNMWADCEGHSGLARGVGLGSQVQGGRRKQATQTCFGIFGVKSIYPEKWRRESQKPSNFRKNTSKSKVAEQDSLNEAHMCSTWKGSNKSQKCNEFPPPAPNCKHMVKPISGARIFYSCVWALTQPTLCFLKQPTC